MAKNALLFKGGPLRQLKHGARRTGGRNNLGRITSFHRGGGAKRSLRDIDMKRSEPDMIGTVERIEYDPFRTGRTALIRWDDDGKERAPMQRRANGDKEDRKIKETKGREFPRGVRDVPRQALRSAVATICGVSVLPTPRRPVMVKVDGTRKFSSLAGETGRNAMGIFGEGLPCSSNFLGKEDQLKYFEERSLKDLTTGRCKGIIHRSPILTGIIIEKLSETKIQ